MTNVAARIKMCHVQGNRRPENATIFVPAYTGDAAKHAIFRKFPNFLARSSLKYMPQSEKDNTQEKNKGIDEPCLHEKI